MRILTVRQPWAWAIIHGGKDVENRVRNIAGDYRGPVAIHVAQADAETAPEALWVDHAQWYDLAKFPLRKPNEFDPSFFDRGHIIGVVDLVDVHNLHRGPEEERHLPRCSAWADQDAWHMVFANPRPLDEPISYRGALGLRRLDGDTIARISRELS